MPRERTQSGIAEAAAIHVKHVPQYVRPMLAEGYLRERSAHVAGGRQRRKAYFLTQAGRQEATRIRTAFLDKEVIVESEEGRRTMTLREASLVRSPGVPILGILRGIDEHGIFQGPPIVVPPQIVPKQPRGQGLGDSRRALERARTFEQRHDWADAEASYTEALDLLPPSQAALRAEVLERSALSSFRLAFQAESNQGFRTQMTRALARYEETLEAVRGRPDAGSGRVSRCEAMVAYARYWLATDAPTKRAELAEVRRLTSQALRAFDGAGKSLEHGRTFNELAFGVFCNTVYQETREAISEIYEELVVWGERTMELLESAGERIELARACATTACFQRMQGAFAPGLRAETDRKALGSWRRALRLSEPEAYGSLRNGPSLWGTGTQEAFEVYAKALEQATEWKDVLGMAYAHDNLNFQLFWRAQGLEDMASQVDLYKQALRHTLDAKRFFDILGHERLYLGGLTPSDPYPDYYWNLADLEPDREKKHELLERVRDAAPAQVAWAEASGAPRVVAAAYSSLGDVLAALSRLEPRPDARQRLLEKALEHAEKGVALAEPVEVFAFNRGWIRDDLARILTELSNVSRDDGTSVAYLQRAIREKERSLQQYTEGESFDEEAGDPGGIAEIGKRWYELGSMYVRLADRLRNREPLKKAVKAYESAVGSYEKLGLSSRIAECHWRAAQAQDSAGDFAWAAESFRRAADAFNTAAMRLPALRSIHQDRGFFMEAWAEIEEGRSRHARRDYGRARENFERSAILHRASRRWAYLAPNYLAWARLEDAEDQSRKENLPEAIRAFSEAAQLFDDASRSLRAQKKELEDPEEDRLVARLIEAAVVRKRYCQARRTFEEASAAEESGDPAAAAEKYRLAAERFDALLQGLESEEDRRDVGLILALSKASHRMARAESTGSSEDYREASSLFEEAAKTSDDERSKAVAEGHGYLCHAWDSGMRFLESRDAGTYAAASESLQRAEDCYRRAGVERSAIHARAGRILFDAWNQLQEADRARNPEERVKGYKIAERMLRLAASNLGKAGHTHLRERVNGLLDQIGREREMAMSLAGLLRAPALPVSTSAFSTPAQTHERSTGLDSIEHAGLQVNLVAHRKAFRLAERFRLKVELVNAGRSPARLLRIEALVPKGFELVGAPKPHVVRGRSLDLRGRRLAPLESDAVTLTLAARNSGTFQMAPRILYLDENGNSRTLRSEPLEINVASPETPARSRSKRRQ